MRRGSTLDAAHAVCRVSLHAASNSMSRSASYPLCTYLIAEKPSIRILYFLISTFCTTRGEEIAPLTIYLSLAIYKTAAGTEPVSGSLGDRQ